MSSHVDCISCIVGKAERLADKHTKDKHKKYIFMQKVLEAIQATDFQRSAPVLDAKVMRVAKETFDLEDFYKEEKKYFNDTLLSMESEVEAILHNSKNALFDALKIALSGNIIDFSSLSQVTIEAVTETITKTLSSQFDEILFKRLRNEMGKGSRIVYLGDNTGELVLDKIFIKAIKSHYPHLEVIYVTRGKPIFNDATEEDAYYVGLNEVASIINNGTDLPGTDLLEVTEEFRKVLDDSDLIIAKGQGNFESLTGCNKNVYYLFLCKCEMLMAKLEKGRFEHMFISEL